MVFDQSTEPPQTEGATGGNFFTQKLGPLPMWVWIGAGVAGVYLYSKYKASKSTTATTTTGADTGTNAVGSTTQTGEDIIVTQMEPGATSEAVPQTPPQTPVNSAVTTAQTQAYNVGVEAAVYNAWNHATGSLKAAIAKAYGSTPKPPPVNGAGGLTLTSADGTLLAYETGVSYGYQNLDNHLPAAVQNAYKVMTGTSPRVVATPVYARPVSS